MTERLEIIRPDDWHVHLRDGAMLETVVNFTAHQFARAIVMPNLAPPVTTVAAARAYRDRINSVVRETLSFEPLLTCYLTDGIDAEELRTGHEEGVFTAAKLYPAHATTNSAHGVSDIKNIYGALEVMQKTGMPLLVHGEVTHSDVDIFDREAVFIDQVLIPLMTDFPALKIVFEHITTAEAADFVFEGPDNLGATVTPHHLEFNRNAIFKGGIRPHYYCLPIAKREKHRLALRRVVTSGSNKFFLGTDSAPHMIGAKESACGCAGLFNAPCALQSYLKTFEEEGALDRFETFASLNGPAFYGLPVNKETIVLEKSPVKIPEAILVDDSHVVPFHAGEAMDWSFGAIDS